MATPAKATSTFLSTRALLLVCVGGGLIGAGRCVRLAVTHLSAPAEYWLYLLEDAEEVLSGRLLLLSCCGHLLTIVLLVIFHPVVLVVTPSPLLLILVMASTLVISSLPLVVSWAGIAIPSTSLIFLILIATIRLTIRWTLPIA